MHGNVTAARRSSTASMAFSENAPSSGLGKINSPSSIAHLVEDRECRFGKRHDMVLMRLHASPGIFYVDGAD